VGLLFPERNWHSIKMPSPSLENSWKQADYVQASKNKVKIGK